MTKLFVRSKEKGEVSLPTSPGRNGVPLWFLRALRGAKWRLRQHVPRRWLDVDAFFVTTRSLTRDIEETDQRWAVRWATCEDADALRQIDETASGVVRDQLGDGFSVALVEKAGCIIAFKVMTTRYRRQGFFEFDLPDDSVWNVYIWVSPHWRSHGLVHVMHRFTSQRWRSYGHQRSFTTLDALMRLIAVERKTKGRILYRMFYVRVLGYTAIRINRSWHFGRWSDSSPLRLNLP